METIEFSRWKVDCDSEATRAAYALIRQGAPEVCGCLHCRNFVAARSQVYGPQVLALFDRLGVNSEREAEVYHNARVAPALHSYGGWFHVVGTLVSGADGKQRVADDVWTFDYQPAAPRFSLGFTVDSQLVPGPFKELNLVQLEFSAEVPWVLDDPDTE